MTPEPNYTTLNPGIVETVRWLRANGFDTCDSGDGETHQFECDYECPYVHMRCAPDKLVSEANRLMDLLAARGINFQPMDEKNSVPTVDCSYSPLFDVGFIALYNVKLPCTKRAPTLS